MISVWESGSITFVPPRYQRRGGWDARVGKATEIGTDRIASTFTNVVLCPRGHELREFSSPQGGCDNRCWNAKRLRRLWEIKRSRNSPAGGHGLSSSSVTENSQLEIPLGNKCAPTMWEVTFDRKSVTQSARLATQFPRSLDPSRLRDLPGNRVSRHVD